jgi:NAD(P)-dependent dehydrogenase (short-subunit alcohol dehydrogenase family)
MSGRYDLEGRVALITGAGRERGMGQATAVRLAREGVHIAVSDICHPMQAYPDLQLGDWEGVQGVAGRVEAQGVRALPLKIDVADKGQVRDGVERVISTFGRLDILVNNAGGAVSHAPIVRMDACAWRDTMDMNLTGAFLCTRYAAREMISAGNGGRIINISSTNGLSGWPELAHYNAAKAAIISLTQTSAIEFGPSGITVNAICPGNIDTQMVRNPYEKAAAQGHIPSLEGVYRAMAEEVCLKRVGQPEDVANVVALLCSADAGFITGQAISVCGGLMIGAMVTQFEDAYISGAMD